MCSKKRCFLKGKRVNRYGAWALKRKQNAHKLQTLTLLMKILGFQFIYSHPLFEGCNKLGRLPQKKNVQRSKLRYFGITTDPKCLSWSFLYHYFVAIWVLLLVIGHNELVWLTGKLSISTLLAIFWLKIHLIDSAEIMKNNYV